MKETLIVLFVFYCIQILVISAVVLDDNNRNTFKNKLEILLYYIPYSWIVLIGIKLINKIKEY
jgi:hypothetical protein